MKQQNQTFDVTCWGSGTLYVNFCMWMIWLKLAFLFLELAPSSDENSFLNVGTGIDLSIRELAK